MSFIDNIVGFGKKALGFLGGNSIGSSLARTALLGLALNKVSKSIQKASEREDPGSRVQLNPDTTNQIPVVYGDAYIAGSVTDAYLSSDNLTMWFCITLCEKTGALINGTDSVISFEEAYWNGLRLKFQSNGYTVDKAYDEFGNSTDAYNGLIEIYPFNDGSQFPTGFTSETSSNSSNAYDLFPGWDSNKSMSELVFVLVKMKYNSEKRVTNLGNFQFKISNTMRQPGDCLYDYATNTRYGAGIPQAEINKS
jgi:hypothetical protein